MVCIYCHSQLRFEEDTYGFNVVCVLNGHTWYGARLAAEPPIKRDRRGVES